MDSKALKNRIAKSQLSIGEVARRAGISPDVVYKAMSGRRKPTLSTIGKLAEALGCEPADLMK